MLHGSLGKRQARPNFLNKTAHSRRQRRSESLKNKLQRALQNAGIVGGQDLPERRAVQSHRRSDQSGASGGRSVARRAVRRPKVGVVRNVKRLKPELDALPLAEGEGPRQGGIKVESSRRQNVVGTQVSVCTQRRLREGRRIQVAGWIPVRLINIR